MTNKLYLAIINAFSAICFMLAGYSFLLDGRFFVGFLNLITSIIQSILAFKNLNNYKMDTKINSLEKYN